MHDDRRRSATLPLAVGHRLAGGLYLRRRRPARAAGTVLWIHGLGESALCFERLLAEPRLGRWQHLAPDLPGYGKSPWRRGEPLGFAAQADALARLLRRLETPPAVVVGHSMGGVVGTVLAERAPDVVRALVDVEGNVSFDDCTTSREVAELSLEQLVAGGLETVRDRVYRRGLEERPLRGYFASLSLCDPRALHRDSRRLVELSRDEVLAPRLGALALPVLYLLGDPGGAGRRSRRLLDRAGVPWRAIRPAGHWPFLDQHEAFVEELLAFLEELG
ncbi:MAG: alpha/beta fold hydrolase [Acidobacteria bacterium]|nr:MAG: alpha/beta fold hydrolase [Acidobacteriota bacterium]